jgi:hypothetical protein
LKERGLYYKIKNFLDSLYILGGEFIKLELFKNGNITIGERRGSCLIFF